MNESTRSVKGKKSVVVHRSQFTVTSVDAVGCSSCCVQGVAQFSDRIAVVHDVYMVAACSAGTPSLCWQHAFTIHCIQSYQPLYSIIKSFKTVGKLEY